MNDVVYPAILTYEDNVIYVSLPNFSEEKCFTYGDTLSKAIKSAKEVLTLYLFDLLEEEKEFPKPLNIKSLKNKLEKNQGIIYISLCFPYQLSSIKSVHNNSSIFPAIFKKKQEGYSVRFPDIEGAFTYGESFEEAFLTAKKYLKSNLNSIEEISNIENISLEKNEYLVIIQIEANLKK